MNELIAIIDDEPDIRELVRIHLSKAGFRTALFPDARRFFDWQKNNLPNLIVLDLMLPDMDGTEVCKIIKNDERSARVPVIMLTARTDEIDKVLGLEIGADDYVTKPFSTKELVARVKAVLRRTETTALPKTLVTYEGLTIDFEKYEISADGKSINLTPTEFHILKILTRKPGYVFNRDRILQELWGEDKIVIARTIDVHIKNLRDKLGKYGKCIQNLRGIGYRIQI
ncbi:MAG: response regulator transcription factor [Candidatus Neomarinimicrobiota bacterium]